ncbi:MAG: multicopper oxidase domain-containing protein [Roseiflexaceae bacterium]
MAEKRGVFRSKLSRRGFMGLLGLGGALGGGALLRRLVPPQQDALARGVPFEYHNDTRPYHMHSANRTVGEVDHARNGFNPSDMLTDFDYGTISTLPDGRTLREWTLTAGDQEIEVAPGVFFAGWAYNGRIPGPTLRCTAGDRLRITLINGSSHPHSAHFHGIHPAAADGIDPVQPGGTAVYEFDAEPFGLHLYHCHTSPITRHLHKGLYGAFIIDPPAPRPPAKELVMVMNAFDTNFDGENEIYAVNTIGFHYDRHPIPIEVGELIRVYLVNVTEFDPLNSFHLHANMFQLYRTGTRLEPHEYTDIVMLAQGERHILEFSYKYPGQYMFHAHQSKFVELGWLSFFDVREPSAAFAPAELAGVCELPA